MSNSRAWAIMTRDFLDNKDRAKQLIYRHFAWLTALRYQLRTSRDWETASKPYNAEYKKFYSVPEKETPLEEELEKYISKEEIKYILTTHNRAGQLISLQSKAVRELYDNGMIDSLKFSDMHKAVRDFYEHQGIANHLNPANW